MDRQRIKLQEMAPSISSCFRCQATGRNWDQVGGKPYCPNCQEAAAVGESRPIRERAEAKPCAVCAHRRTLRFVTFPLHADVPVEMSLCADHLQRMLARQLGPYAYIQLRRQLRALHITPDDIFLLHHEFYDAHGQALRPAQEAD